jgi:putative phosphoesterase
MKIGVMSDTHSDVAGAIPLIIATFKEKGVKVIIHCGDLNREHVSGSLFGNLPVYCALVGDQKDDTFFVKNCPENWTFTRSGQRFVTLPDGTRAYVGHQRHMDAMRKTGPKFNSILAGLRTEFDGLRFVFGGHLHFQAFQQGQLVSFINPGAVEEAISHRSEFAILDTETGEIVFERLPPGTIPDDRPAWKIGIISDSLDVSHSDVRFWTKLADNFKERGVSHIIHCGNLDLNDIGRPELAGFKVHYALREDQRGAYNRLTKEGKPLAENWVPITLDGNMDKGGVVDINGYRFFVQLDLGLRFAVKTELDMAMMATEIRRQHPETEFVVCGFTHNAMFFAGEQVTTINPGDVVASHSYAVISLPRREVTFGRIAYDPLPKLITTK